jgi:cytochrome c-type biogenesis protein CcmH
MRTLIVRNTRLVIAVALLAIAAALVLAARPHEPTADERVDRITAELRCPVCQGLSVKDSPSATARQMRALVVERVREGKSDAEIEAEFRAAYGDWVLLSPPVASWSGLIWLAPLAALAAGAVLATARVRPTPVGTAGRPSAAQLAALRERVAREEAAEG